MSDVGPQGDMGQPGWPRRRTDKKLRFHLLGLAHLPFSLRFNCCAFTAKNVKLAKMLLSLGHEVICYGVRSREGDTTPCTEFVETHKVDQIARDYGDGDNRWEIGYDWQGQFFRHDFERSDKPSTAMFRAACIEQINARKRPDDFLLVTQGFYHKPIADAVKLRLTVESGIGYRGSWAEFRAFESSYIQHFTYGSEHPRQSINGSYYDRVIPNAVDDDEVVTREEAAAAERSYYLYLGRMIQRKGVQTAYKTCEAIGAKLILCGQGAKILPNGSLCGDDFTIPFGNWEYVGYADYERRKDLMTHAIASFSPTLYLEPFAGAHVEAMLHGTPVLTTDFGVYPDTVINGVNGFRCHTLQDFVDGAQAARYMDNASVRASAERFLCENVRWLYHKWFCELHDVWESQQDPSKKAWHRLVL